MKSLLAVLLLVAPLHAQDTIHRFDPPPIGDIILKAQQGIDTAATPGVEAGNSPVDLDTPCSSIDDAETKALCWEAFRARLRYYEHGLDHRTSVLAWQHASTIGIFFVVLGLVVVGVGFAWVQFRRGLQRPEGAPEPDHELDISMKGIKVRSPVLGVIILALSLAFFYLYIRYVYPISEVF